MGTTTFERRWNNLMIVIAAYDKSIEARSVSNRTVKQKEEEEDKTKKDPPVLRSALTPHYFRHNYATILYTAGVRLEVAAN